MESIVYRQDRSFSEPLTLRKLGAFHLRPPAGVGSSRVVNDAVPHLEDLRDKVALLSRLERSYFDDSFVELHQVWEYRQLLVYRFIAINLVHPTHGIETILSKLLYRAVE